jgi:outer membrane murein-binding lipoprotein Lpp
MKTTMTIIMLFTIILPCFAELTQQDLDKISNLIDKKLEPINKEIIAIEKEIMAIKLDIAEMKGKMATKDDIIGVYAAILVTWVVTIAAIVTIPYLYGRADRERVKQLESDVRELIKLKAEVEVLKAIREDEERRRETARRIAEGKPEFEEAYRIVGLL